MVIRTVLYGLSVQYVQVPYGVLGLPSVFTRLGYLSVTSSYLPSLPPSKHPHVTCDPMAKWNLELGEDGSSPGFPLSSLTGRRLSLVAIQSWKPLAWQPRDLDEKASIPEEAKVPLRCSQAGSWSRCARDLTTDARQIFLIPFLLFFFFPRNLSASYRTAPHRTSMPTGHRHCCGTPTPTPSDDRLAPRPPHCRVGWMLPSSAVSSEPCEPGRVGVGVGTARYKAARTSFSPSVAIPTSARLPV
ncbi:hypothetical protein B0H66DRAFT_82505 [Apodospora peruviana]|uniref:Uncharacterized protein n=1 Tax=Apodospora peruviana TaxID=516989 RepID=A0AAE0ITM7_9PEZI|nr:hypothetical protein B0H66DRAFT_82505 [Apodospora peruviana]